VETNVLAGERGQYRLMQPAQGSTTWRRPTGWSNVESNCLHGNDEGVLGGHALPTRLPLQVREHTHSAVHMLRGHHDDFGADAVEFQIDPGVIERQVAYAE
jgi:hypothetical protein